MQESKLEVTKVVSFLQNDRKSTTYIQFPLITACSILHLNSPINIADSQQSSHTLAIAIRCMLNKQRSREIVTKHSTGEKEKCTNKEDDKHEDFDSLLYNQCWESARIS